MCNVVKFYKHHDSQLQITVDKYFYLHFRMSAKDLDIQPPRKKKNSSLNCSMGNGMDSIMQQENGVVRGRSLPTLLDVPLHPDVDVVYVPESVTDPTIGEDE